MLIGRAVGVRPFHRRSGARFPAAAARRRISRRCSSSSTSASRSRAPIRRRSPRARRRRRCWQTGSRARRPCSAGARSGAHQNHPRRRPRRPETVASGTSTKSLAFYKARFADASHFTFVFVGSFTPETIRPLVETYLASLPATHAKGEVARHRRRAADRRGREDGREGDRAEERGGDRLRRAVRYDERTSWRCGR